MVIKLKWGHLGGPQCNLTPIVIRDNKFRHTDSEGRPCEDTEKW